jgi:hydroxypyruvate isomerase
LTQVSNLSKLHTEGKTIVNRREFGKYAAGAAMVSMLPTSNALAQAVAPKKKCPFSVMIWVLTKQAPFERCLEYVTQAGYQGIELTGQYEKWSPEERKRMIAKMHALNLVVDLTSSVKGGFAQLNNSSQYVAALEDQIAMAKELGCSAINLMSGNRIEGAPSGAQHAASIDNLKRAADIAEKHQVSFVIETIDVLENPKYYLTGVTEAFDIVRAVGSPRVKVLYDFYHEQRGMGNLIEKIEPNIDLIGLVHIADVPGRHEPGTGEMNYENIYRKLAALNYDRYVTMEFYPTGDPVKQITAARLTAQRCGL